VLLRVKGAVHLDIRDLPAQLLKESGDETAFCPILLDHTLLQIATVPVIAEKIKPV
jgi:hypothetical protein